MGQHRYLRMARLSDADQGRFSLPRFDSRSTDRPRSGPVDGPGATYFGTERLGHPGVAQLLLQVADDGSGPVSGARPVHPVNEAEEHAAALKGRGTDHSPGAGVLRLSPGLDRLTTDFYDGGDASLQGSPCLCYND